ncbi:hypothetical protein [Methanosarcina horonobensis]|uniref:hypothetical protein n=1 Tax=Methanosarcina horonobensis TaxID=418008 RepID=UPI0022B8C865|nr:hypothetical protein [Methanosarcina horonobensis]
MPLKENRESREKRKWKNNKKKWDKYQNNINPYRPNNQYAGKSRIPGKKGTERK